MRGHTTGKAHRRTEVIPYVEIWKQSTFWWIVSQAYHFMWEKPSAPIMEHVSRWHKKIFEKTDEYIPLSNRQDIRCYRLRQKKRDLLAVIYITQEQHDIITGKALKIEEPRHEVKEPISPEE